MTAEFTYWQEDVGTFLGYLNHDPDHWTQGETLQALKEHLRDLHRTFAPDSPSPFNSSSDETVDEADSSTVCCG